MVCTVKAVTVQTHDKAMQLAERYGLSFYDSLVVSAALLSGCASLYSEDMQDGLLVEGQLTIRNPFRSP